MGASCCNTLRSTDDVGSGRSAMRVRRVVMVRHCNHCVYFLYERGHSSFLTSVTVIGLLTINGAKDTEAQHHQCDAVVVVVCSLLCGRCCDGCYWCVVSCQYLLGHKRTSQLPPTVGGEDSRGIYHEGRHRRDVSDRSGEEKE